MPSERNVLLEREPIELFKILKFEGLVGSGGEAKGAIAAGQVTLNGEVEIRKRRQVVAGDVVGFAGVRLRMHRADAAAPTDGRLD